MGHDLAGLERQRFEQRIFRRGEFDLATLDLHDVTAEVDGKVACFEVGILGRGGGAALDGSEPR